MNIFNLHKTSQQNNVQISAGYNIINFIKLLLSNEDKDLLQSGFTQKHIRHFRIMAEKNISTLNSIDIVFLKQNIPQYLKTSDVMLLLSHAVGFINKTDSTLDARINNKSLPKIISIPVLKKSQEKEPESRQEKSIYPLPSATKKKLKGFTFTSKELPYWTKLIITFHSAKEYGETKRQIEAIENLTLTSNATTLSIEIQYVNEEQFRAIENVLLSIYESLPPEESKPVLPNQEQATDRARTIDLIIEDARDSTETNWMYKIKIKNLPQVSTECQVNIIDCIDTSFIGTTKDITYTKKTIDDEGLRIERKRLCQTGSDTTDSVSKQGLYVRGDISDFQAFFQMCQVRNIIFKTNDFAKTVFSDLRNSRFYDSKTGASLSNKAIRIEGVLDAESDGYDNNQAFTDKSREISAVGLKSGLSDSAQENIVVYSKQLEGIEYLYTRTRAILGDDTGGGKTFQAIVAAHMRLDTDSRKMNKNMRAIVITASGVVSQYKREISKFTGIDEKFIWTGDQVLESLINSGMTDLESIRKNTRPPEWKWCIMNYNKFSIPPRPQIMQAVAKAKEDSFLKYHSIMKGSVNLANSVVNKLKTYIEALPVKKENDIERFIKDNTIDPTSGNFKPITFNAKLKTSFNKEYPQEKDASTIASTAYVLLLANYNPIKDAMSKIIQVTDNDIKMKKDDIDKSVQATGIRILATDELIQLKIDLENTKDEDQKIEIQADIKRISEGGQSIAWGYDGKRKILTSYFHSLSEMGILDIVILDEIHRVKNGDPGNRSSTMEGQHEDSHTTFNTQIVTSRANNVWGFSATIVANTPIDLYNQLVAINSPLGDLPYETFITDIVRTRWNNYIEATDAEAIKTIMLQHGLYMQRSKEDIYADRNDKKLFPKQIVHDVLLPDKDEAYQRILQASLTVLMTRGSDNNPLAVYGAIRASLALAKCDHTIDFCFNKILEGKRVGIFTDSKPAGNKIKNGIAAKIKNLPSSHKFYNKEVYLLNGDSPNANDERQTNIDEFKKSCDHTECGSRYAAIVISYDVGGTGISMENSADTVVFNDLPDTPINDTQARGRFFRLNTNTDNHIFYMLLDVEHDEKMYETLLRKIRIADTIQKLTQAETLLIMQGQQHSPEIIRIRLEKAKIAKELKSLSNRDLFTSNGGLASKVVKKSYFFDGWYKQALFLNQI